MNSTMRIIRKGILVHSLLYILSSAETGVKLSEETDLLFTNFDKTYRSEPTEVLRDLESSSLRATVLLMSVDLFDGQHYSDFPVPHSAVGSLDRRPYTVSAKSVINGVGYIKNPSRFTVDETIDGNEYACNITFESCHKHGMGASMTEFNGKQNKVSRSKLQLNDIIIGIFSVVMFVLFGVKSINKVHRHHSYKVRCESGDN